MTQGSISDLHVSIKRNLFSPGFHSQSTITGQIEPFGLPYVVDGFARIVSEALSADPLIDIKGADSGRYYTATEAPHLEDQVAMFSGNTIHSSTEDEPASVREPFALSVKTRFAAFRGEGSIVHTARTDRHGALPSAVKLSNIGRVFPLEILKFDIGFDRFTARRYPLLGVSPVVSETVKISADRESFMLSIDADLLAARTALPLERAGMFEQVAAALERLFGFNLRAKYLEQVGG